MRDGNSNPFEKQVYAILTFQPTPTIPLLKQYIISVPYLDAYSSNCFPVMARIRKILLFLFLLLVLFLNGIIATRGKAMLPTLPQKGAAFFPPKMPVPPSGPSKQHNYVPRLRFIPATVVYGSPCSIRRESPPSLVWWRCYLYCNN
ncbi:uncharacterized protein LOC114279195 [Camellia sinensis]|uniref:uncharacterized protein LOC114279195 n=1 Tax=Camellia sinensis TaxID=4442 RepID=UPI001036E3FD|nr:uncharacterized protein LOC114279195 [Camellia sinensis]